MPDPLAVVAEGLAAAFLAGDWEPQHMAARGQRAVGQRRVWVRDLALAARHAWPEPPRDEPRALAAFLTACAPLADAFGQARRRGEPPPSVLRWYTAPTAMTPARWPVARLDTIGDLQALVGMRTTQLRWLADAASLERLVTDERLRHYRYRWVPKRGAGARLIEAPKPVLRHLQRVVLAEVLSAIPPHPTAHGFRPGRSALTHAAGHVGKAVVIRMDLEDFFPSVSAGRVFGIFRVCGYPEAVAHALTALVTNAVPRRVWEGAPDPAGWADAHRRLRGRLATPHLPQGAPTSPALANLAAYRLDRRVAGLARRAGLAYSRYADDLALSSATRRSPAQLERAIDVVRCIAREEGFRLNEPKTSVRRAGQHQRLAGVVVNQVPNVDRRELDRLRATLTNAARSGPAARTAAASPTSAPTSSVASPGSTISTRVGAGAWPSCSSGSTGRRPPASRAGGPRRWRRAGRWR